MIPDFHGKTVLVTGGAIRAGEAVCRAFSAAGAYVVVHCLRARDAADKLCATLGNGGRVVSCDLTDAKAASAMIQEIKPDILVNNAASYSRKTLQEEDGISATRQYQVNFQTPVEMIRTLAAVRGKQKTAVVNILDCAIRKTPSDSFSYALSKKMLAAATRAAAKQCAPWIRINAVAPGNMIPPEGSGLTMKKTMEILPLRHSVSVSDFASAVLFLAGNESITGVILPVDCGQSLLYGEDEL